MTETVRRYTAGEAGLWIQPDGPNGAMYYLGCHDVGDITEPLGDRTLTYCPDESSVNKWKKTGSFQGEPGGITTSITTVMQRARDWLEKNMCAGPIYITKMSCGRRDQWTSWERVLALYNPYQTERTIAGLLARNPGDQAETTMTFNITADALYRLARVELARLITTEPAALNAIAICSEAQCKGACGPARAPAQDAVAVGDFLATSPTDTAAGLVTSNGGGIWTSFASDPFDDGEIISAVTCFPVDAETTRILVARGTADASNPAEVAYSDDGGTTWVNVDVGNSNGQYVARAGALFSLDLYHIWLGTNDGYVYFSGDGGLSWEVQIPGTVIGQVNGIFFADPDVGMVVGANDTILYTEDGGTAWSTVGDTNSGDDILCVGYNGDGIWWVGTDGGGLYYSDDEGDTWTARTFAGSGSGTVTGIQFVNPLVGWMIHNTSAPVGRVFRTVNGGHDWEMVVTPTNSGLNDLAAADEHTAFFVGEVNGGTAVILKATEVA